MKRRKVENLLKLPKALAITFMLIAQVSFAQKNSNVSQKSVKYRIKILEVLPHDVNSYIQGLFFYNQQLYESAGQFKESTFRKVDIITGKTLKSIRFPDEFFAEGSTVIGNKLFILTWKNWVAFVYDINTFKQLGTFFNAREGWGLTTDGKQLIMSDGSSTIYFINPDNFKDISRIEVKLNGKNIDMINELEYINGDIWANVYLKDIILIINPANGVVKATIDCSNLLPENLKTAKTDVLNGIAYNPESKQIYITGKLWPKMYRIQIVK